MDAIDESLLVELRAALEPGADIATRRVGADACRTLLAVLDPPVAAPRETSSPVIAPAPAVPATASVAAVPPPSQVLDMVIAHLRTKLPADHVPRASSGAFRVALIPMRRPEAT
jgi:hypothetical protein